VLSFTPLKTGPKRSDVVKNIETDKQKHKRRQLSRRKGVSKK
jgi:hypothetical protein